MRILGIELDRPFESDIFKKSNLIVSLIAGLFFLTITGLGSCHLQANLIFSASADPNASPDANSNSINIWNMNFSNNTTSQTGSFLGNSGTNGDGVGAGAGTSAWAMYANSGQSATAASVAFSALVGRALNTTGDSVSIDFDNGFIDNGAMTGVRFLSGATTVSTFSFTGGGSVYQIADNTNSSSGIGFTDNGFNISLTLNNTTGGYTLIANGSTFSGRTLASSANSITSIQVFNSNAGEFDAKNVFFNNLVLTAIPEPGSILMFGVAMLSLMPRRKRN